MTEPAEDRNKRFTWRLGDLDIHPTTADAWLVTFEDNGATVLVQDMDGLMQHLMQHTGFDGDLAGAAGHLHGDVDGREHAGAHPRRA